MVSLRLPHLLTILVLSWHSQVSQSKVVCCCPDLTLSLSAVVSDSTKSLQNGFMFVATKDSTVSLMCDLGDKDHGAVKSVVYKFHKTYELGTSKPISLDNKNKELCSDKVASQETCDLLNVQYSDTPDKLTSMDAADNHIYQCYAEITLEDDAVVKLWSHTIKLDVYYPPTKDEAPVISDPKAVSTGKTLEKFLCILPASHPKTKARWSFKKKDTDTWEVIDIPNDSVRGGRLVIAEDVISLLSKDDILRGTLLVMIFNPTEDQGEYKCEGVYDTVFDDTDKSFDISLYEVKTNGQQDSGALLLRTVSAITEPKLVNEDSNVTFTVYARDTPGRDQYGDVSYVWQIKGSQNVDVNFTKYADTLKLSNHDRTLTVSDLTKHRDHEFHCQVRRTTNGNTEEITSDPLGVTTTAVVIAPKDLSIPLTSRTCVNHGANLKATPNKAYMMPNADLAGDDPQQILLKADSYKFYINAYKVMFISDNEVNFDKETEAGVTQEQFAKKLPDNANDRCIYWQYLRGYGLQYQLIEVMRTDRLTDNGCKSVDFRQQLKSDMFEIEKLEGASKVVVTIQEETPIPTMQCVKMDLVDSTEKIILDSKSLSVIAEDSCASRTFPKTVELRIKVLRKKRSESEMKGLKIKIYSESSPDSSFTKDVDPRKCSKPKDILNVASIAPASAEIEAGNKYTITCSPNFVPSQAELLCGEDETLSPSPECVTGTCSKPELTENVESVTPDKVKAGERFTVKCRSGYVPEHSELTCQTDGTVSSLDHTPKCIAGTCSKPELTENVESVTPDKVQLKAGEKFTVTCKSDYVPEHSELTCQTDGTVSSLDNLPKCVYIELPDDAEPVKGDRSKTVTIIVVVVVVLVVAVVSIVAVVMIRRRLLRKQEEAQKEAPKEATKEAPKEAVPLKDIQIAEEKH